MVYAYIYDPKSKVSILKKKKECSEKAITLA